jgi:hypothetical protein
MTKIKPNIYLALMALTAALVGCTTEAAENSGKSAAVASKLPVDVKVVNASSLIQEETLAGSVLPNK